ncbi:hypothetical protein KVT40_002076 [Elsinoe batatas]|uniref:Uncharacterized protein n=1 Tax=Elsinoe batatas TaxID=2601811 RepID=A0A8K0L759_9PEZI|nr:hypothetical protein KVT40_002076 [Elsinoe batatas]
MSGENCGSFESRPWVFASPNRLETLPDLCPLASTRHPIDRSCREDPVAGGVALVQTRSFNLSNQHVAAVASRCSVRRCDPPVRMRRPDQNLFTLWRWQN